MNMSVRKNDTYYYRQEGEGGSRASEDISLTVSSPNNVQLNLTHDLLTLVNGVISGKPTRSVQ